jgi:nitrous oxidase accessory protein
LRISIPLVCTALILVALASWAGASTIKVSSDLQVAISSASPGDTLLVGPGSYDPVVVDKCLNLVGDGATVNANDSGACISITADDVNITGFTVKYGLYGIHLDHVKNCTITKNYATRCNQDGFAVLFSDGNLIEDNIATYNGLGGEGWYGIYLSNSNDNAIRNNVACYNGAYGLNMFPSCNNNTVSGNTLEGNMYGLYMFTGCSGNVIKLNKMANNTNSGVDMRFNCHGNFLLNNTVANNTVAGITLMDSPKNTLRGNKVSGNNRYGLQIQGSSDSNLVAGNSISDSQTGIFVESGKNRFYGNRLIENVVQADDRGKNTWNATYPAGGNLWSDYQGQDSLSGPGQDEPGSDCIGDIPYKVGDASSDKYPLMGGQVKLISILDKRISPSKARVGDNVAIKVKVESKYGLSQVSVKVVGSKGTEAGGYVRMVSSGGYYSGSLVTALLDPGTYDLIITLVDARGHEGKEDLGQLDLMPRGSYDFDASKSNLG